jgi:hypothetical protein
MSEERLARLEERFAWLERRAAEQDKAMLDQWDELRRLRAEVVRLRDHAASAGGLEGRGGAGPGEGASEGSREPDERPPHY